MSYKGAVLRGEKWFHLMTEKEWKADESKKVEVELYLESQKKVEEKAKPKEKK